MIHTLNRTSLVEVQLTLEFIKFDVVDIKALRNYRECSYVEIGWEICNEFVHIF